MRILGYNLKFEKRESSRPTSPLDDRWYQPISFATPSGSGANVTPTTALYNTTVYACVKVITETLASMPLPLYKRTGEKKKEKATDHPLFRILRILPNPRMTSLEFREMLTGHYLLRGNAYAQIIYDGGGDIKELWPLHPGRMEPLITESGEVVYKYTTTAGKPIFFEAKEIFHLRGPTDDGITGRTPIDCFKEAIGLGISMNDYLSNFYGNSASPAGILSLPAGQTLTPKAKDRLREDWKKKFSGSYRAGNIAVLEEGVTWQTVGMTAADAQYIETQKSNALAICGAFRMPPHKVGILDNAKYSNIEFQNIEFLTDTMLPHLRRWEQRIEVDLLRNERPDKYYAEFMVDGILRGDLESRYKSYAVGRQWGWLSVNDIRAKENENPVEGGDIYLQPLNMIEASQAMDYLLKPKDNTAKPPGNKDPTADPGNPTLTNSDSAQVLALKRALASLLDFSQNAPKPPENLNNSEETTQIERKKILNESVTEMRASMELVFADVFTRILIKENNAIVAARKRLNFKELETNFYPAHEEFCRKVLAPSSESFYRSLAATIRLAEPQVALSQLDSLRDPSALAEIVNGVVKRYIDPSKQKESSDVDAEAKILAQSLAGSIVSMVIPQ